VADRRLRLATAATYAVLALSMADNTTVGVAVPRVRETFHLGVTSLQWIVAGYIVAFAGLLFTGGVLGDRYGRRKALVAGIATFGVGATVAATAPDWRVLVAGRVLQGVGAACSEPGTLSLLRQLHPDETTRLRVFGGWAAASGLALAAGPVAAGLLVSIGGWRAVFAAEAIAALLAAVVGAALLPESADPPTGRGDVRGQVLAAMCLAATTYALIDGQERGFGSLPVVLAWIVAAGALVLFVHVERRHPEPVLDLALFRDRTVSAGLLAAAASTFALFSVLLLVSLDLQIVGGFSGLGTAGIFAPMTVAMVLAGPAGARLAARHGPATPLVAGLLIATAACIGLDVVLVRPVPVASTIVALTVLGAGFGLVVAPMVGTVLARVPARRSGMGAAAVTAGREIGGVMGVAILGAIVNGLLFRRLTDRLVDLGIPVSYRHVVIDAVRRGTSLPKHGGGSGDGGSFLGRFLGAIRQNLTDRTVDAGKGAYVDSVRTALIVAICVLAVGAAGVWLLLRNAETDTPTTVG
jgi:predicted MFS family arabinose efflux permease